MRHVSTTCKRLEQIVDDVMLLSDAVAILNDEKYFNAFEKYVKSILFSMNLFYFWSLFSFCKNYFCTDINTTSLI